MGRERQYTRHEELTNALSHSFGIITGLIAGYYLLKASAGNPWATGSVIVYLFGMLFCYILSVAYHESRDNKRKLLFQKLDHAGIYLHIAGSYTPFTLVTLRNEGLWGWGLFIFIWLFAATGIALSFRKHDKHSHLETICYIIMGCAILVALNPLLHVLSETGRTEAFYWLVTGGASYIIGTVFYSWTSRPYMHTVFHFFVLGGSICHILAIYMAVLP